MRAGPGAWFGRGLRRRAWPRPGGHASGGPQTAFNTQRGGARPRPRARLCPARRRRGRFSQRSCLFWLHTCLRRVVYGGSVCVPSLFWHLWHLLSPAPLVWPGSPGRRVWEWGGACATTRAGVATLHGRLNPCARVSGRPERARDAGVTPLPTCFCFMRLVPLPLAPASWRACG